MKMTKTECSRVVRVTGIPDRKKMGLMGEMDIEFHYVLSPGSSILDHAVTLDSVVIPAIIRAINGKKKGKKAKSGGYTVLENVEA